MGGRFPQCPFCPKVCNESGVKDHVKAKHPEIYDFWRDNGFFQYWQAKEFLAKSWIK